MLNLILCTHIAVLSARLPGQPFVPLFLLESFCVHSAMRLLLAYTLYNKE